jgi:OmpA-OmpF porin, OOP family
MKPICILSKTLIQAGKTISFLLIAGCLLIPVSGFSQLNLKGKLKDAANNRVNNKVDQGVDKSMDAVENGVKNIFKKKDETKTQEGKTTESSGDTKSEQQALQSFSNYDFVPGDKVLFFEDFSQDAIGDFPALWTSNGSGEVKTVNVAPGDWLHLNTKGALYWYQKNINFPSNFILEFDIIPDEALDQYVAELDIYGEEKRKEMDDGLFPGNKGLRIDLDLAQWKTTGYDDNTETDDLISESPKSTVEKGKVNHVILWIQNRRVRIYHKGMKVLDAPTAIIEGTQFSRLRFSLWDKEALPYISNIKITTAAPDTRSKLLTEGKLVSYGIYFDVNKDVVKSESYGTLNDIAKVLKENPTVRITIVGHTDADGADAANLDLSKRRGASVKNELIKTFGIDASRIESDGLGETKPIAPNDTPANKALNRRVEFIKL